MTRRRPILCWPILTTAVCAAVWWTLHVPHTPRKIFSAIPVQATFLSAHKNLAGRWDAVGANPLTQSVLMYLNTSQDDWRSLNRDPQFRDWLSRLASDDFALAFVPQLAEGETGWVFASWLGGKSQRLRFALQWSEIPGITFAGTRHGWPVWIASSPMFKGGEVLAFSLVEGMLVASYAKSAHGIETVLSCVDGRYPSLMIRNGGDEIPPPDFSDRGWYRIPDSSKGFFNAPRLQFSFSTISSNKLAGIFRVPFSWLEGARPLPETAPDSIASWQTDLPSAVLIAPSANARDWILQCGTDSVSRAFADLIRDETGGPLFASLFTGDYRGTLFGMKLPALFVAAASTNANEFSAQLSRGLDAVNAENPWGLRAEKSLSPIADVFAISATNGSLYSDSARGEKIGFAAGTNWVLASSCVGAFTNVLGDAVLRENRPARFALAAKSAARGGAAAYFWINLPGCWPAVRTGVGAYSMRLQMEDRRGSAAFRAELTSALDWFVNLSLLGGAEFWAKPVAGGATEIRFETTTE